MYTVYSRYKGAAKCLCASSLNNAVGEGDNCGSASRLNVVNRFGYIIQKNLHKLTITATLYSTLYYLGVNMSRPRSPFGLRSSWSSLKRVRKHG